MSFGEAKNMSERSHQGPRCCNRREHVQSVASHAAVRKPAAGSAGLNTSVGIGLGLPIAILYPSPRIQSSFHFH